MKFTRTTIGELTLPSGKLDHVHWDSELPGFGLRLRGESRSWLIQYRAHGKQHRESLGDIRKVTLEAARKVARQRFAQIELGVDPAAEKAKARLATNKALTLGATVTRYLEAKRGTLRPGTMAAATSHLTKHWKPLANRPLASVTRADVAAQLQVLTRERGRVSAARARSNLSALYAWAIGEGLTAGANPVDGSNRPDEDVKSRDRVLNEQELAAVWNACGDDNGGRVIKLLILTGARRNEIGKLLWREFDSDKGILIVSGTRTKNHHDLKLPLPSVALELLREAPRYGDHVFGKHGFTNWTDLKAELDARSGVSGWTLHDLRRSTATHMADIGIQPHVIEEILNHRSGHKAGPAGIYNRSSYEREVRIALETWCDRITALAEGRDPKVITMRPMAAEGGAHG